MSTEDKLLEARLGLLLEKIVDFDGDWYNIPDDALPAIKRMLQTGETPEQFDRRTAAAFGAASTGDWDEGDDLLQGPEGMEDRTYHARDAYTKMIGELQTSSPETLEKVQRLGLIDEEDIVQAIQAASRGGKQSPYNRSNKNKTPVKLKSDGTLSDAAMTDIKKQLAATTGNAGGAKVGVDDAAVLKDLLARAYVSGPDDFIAAWSTPPSGFPRSPPTAKETIDIPAGFANVRQYTLKGGKSVGAGEMLVPLMFTDGRVVAGGNPTFDTQIGNKGYHVKEANPTNGIKFGSASGKMFAGSEMQTFMGDFSEREWESAGVDKRLRKKMLSGEIGSVDLKKVIEGFSTLLKSQGSLTASPEAIYKVLTCEARARAIPEDENGWGTIWVKPKGGLKLTFLPKHEHYVKAMTQGGRYILSSAPIVGSAFGDVCTDVQAAINNLRPDEEPEEIYSSHNRLLDLRVNLLVEELTRSDKRDIQRMIAKQIEADRSEQKKQTQKQFEAELKKVLGKDLMGGPAKINKAIQEIAKRELQKELKGKELKDAMAEVTKVVMKKLYRELAYSYTPVIDRIKI